MATEHESKILPTQPTPTTAQGTTLQASNSNPPKEVQPFMQGTTSSLLNTPTSTSKDGSTSSQQTLTTINPHQQESSTLSPEKKLRNVYINLFHELQFRATKNALMNYHEASTNENKGYFRKLSANILTVLSASGVVGSVAKKGKSLLSSKAGVVGVLGLPLCGILQFMESCTLDILPSYSETARKHVTAAASWNLVSARARAAYLCLEADPTYSLKEAINLYDELLKTREEISKLVLIPYETHEIFTQNTDKVYLAIKKRSDAYKKFTAIGKSDNFAFADTDAADNIYF